MFTREDLTKPTTFFDDAKKCPENIEGKGQRVYFQNAIYVLYNEKGTAVSRQDTPVKGEGIIPKNTTFWCGNKDGKVKDWE